MATDATVTGTTELSTGAWALTGALLLNGVRIPIYSEDTEGALKTINRFTPQTGVTASEADKYLVLTADSDTMRVDGDTAVLNAFGLTGGVTKASSEAPTPTPTPPIA